MLPAQLGSDSEEHGSSNDCARRLRDTRSTTEVVIPSGPLLLAMHSGESSFRTGTVLPPLLSFLVTGRGASLVFFLLGALFFLNLFSSYVRELNP